MPPPEKFVYIKTHHSTIPNYLCVDKIPANFHPPPPTSTTRKPVKTAHVLFYWLTRPPASLPPSPPSLGRHGRRNPILARFRPSPTPSAEHAPTPAHPRTPAHLLDINNPDCYLVKKKSPGPFFLYIERSPSPRLPVSPSPRLTYLVS